jgi:hypothetical protein
MEKFDITFLNPVGCLFSLHHQLLESRKITVREQNMD